MKKGVKHSRFGITVADAEPGEGGEGSQRKTHMSKDELPMRGVTILMDLQSEASQHGGSTKCLQYAAERDPSGFRDCLFVHDQQLHAVQATPMILYPKAKLLCCCLGGHLDV